MIANAEIAVGM